MAFVKTLLTRFARHRAGLIGLTIVGLFLAAAILAPVLTAHDPVQGNLALARRGPSPAHLLGTDELGRDVLARLLYGGRVTLRVGAIAVGIGCLVGIPLGAVSGYIGGNFDLLVQRIVDVLMAFPGVLLAILLVSILGVGLDKVMIAVGVVSIPTYTRLVRASVLAVKEQPFVEAARAAGMGPVGILARHILPNVLSPIIVQSSLQFATSILWAAGLGFLGLGAQAPQPEWGANVAAGRLYLRTAPHMVLFPGLAISLVVWGLNQVGDALNDALDPRQWLRGA